MVTQQLIQLLLLIHRIAQLLCCFVTASLWNGCFSASWKCLTKDGCSPARSPKKYNKKVATLIATPSIKNTSQSSGWNNLVYNFAILNTASFESLFPPLFLPVGFALFCGCFKLGFAAKLALVLMEALLKKLWRTSTTKKKDALLGTHTERAESLCVIGWLESWGGEWRRAAWSSSYLQKETPSVLNHSYCSIIQLWMRFSPFFFSLSVSTSGCCCLISVGINFPAYVSQTSAQCRLFHSWRHSRSVSTLALRVPVWQVTPVSSALTAVLLEVAEVAAGSVVTSDSRGERC